MVNPETHNSGHTRHKTKDEDKRKKLNTEN